MSIEDIGASIDRLEQATLRLQHKIEVLAATLVASDSDAIYTVNDESVTVTTIEAAALAVDRFDGEVTGFREGDPGDDVLTVHLNAEAVFARADEMLHQGSRDIAERIAPGVIDMLAARRQRG